jgi:hypothetical protein
MKTIITIALLASATLYAQPNPPQDQGWGNGGGNSMGGGNGNGNFGGGNSGNGNSNSNVPLDGGVVGLLAAGAAVAYKKSKSNKS